MPKAQVETADTVRPHDGYRGLRLPLGSRSEVDREQFPDRLVLLPQQGCKKNLDPVRLRPGYGNIHHPVVRILKWIKIGSIAALAHRLNSQFAADSCACSLAVLLPNARARNFLSL